MTDEKALKILGWFNYYIIQWFFIRIIRKYDDDDGNYIGMGILKWVCPLTGWNSDYKYLRSHFK